MKTTLVKLIGIILVTSSCVSDPDTIGEANIRSNVFLDKKMKINPDKIKLKVAKKVKFKPKKKLVLKVFVHPYAKGSIASEGYYKFVHINSSIWEAQ